MSYNAILVGAAPNDGLGDPLRTGGQKLNAMLAEIYNAINVGAGANTPIIEVNASAGTSDTLMEFSPTALANFAALFGGTFPGPDNQINQVFNFDGALAFLQPLNFQNTKATGVIASSFITNGGDIYSTVNDGVNAFADGLDASAARYVIGKYPFGANTDMIACDQNAVAGNTRLLLWDVDNGQLERVSVGIADSGGVGFKVLRIPN
jgi:hypothetical protein